MYDIIKVLLSCPALLRSAVNLWRSLSVFQNGGNLGPVRERKYRMTVSYRTGSRSWRQLRLNKARWHKHRRVWQTPGEGAAAAVGRFLDLSEASRYVEVDKNLRAETTGRILRKHLDLVTGLPQCKCLWKFFRVRQGFFRRFTTLVLYKISPHRLYAFGLCRQHSYY